MSYNIKTDLGKEVIAGNIDPEALNEIKQDLTHYSKLDFEEIYNGATKTSGTVTITKPYTDFKAILFVCGGGLNAPCVTEIFPKILLDLAQSDNFVRVAGYSNEFIQGYFSTTTSFSIVGNNGIGIVRIYGIK